MSSKDAHKLLPFAMVIFAENQKWCFVKVKLFQSTATVCTDNQNVLLLPFCLGVLFFANSNDFSSLNCHCKTTQQVLLLSFCFGVLFFANSNDFSSLNRHCKTTQQRFCHLQDYFNPLPLIYQAKNVVFFHILQFFYYSIIICEKFVKFL